VDHVGERAGDLDAGRAAADHDEVQRAAREQLGSRSASSKTPIRRERSRVASSSEYSGKACSSAPGVRKKLGCEPPARTSASPSMRSPSAVVHRVGGGVDRRHLRELDVDVGVLAHELAQRVRDVAGRQLRGRDLVEQRLELVVVVAVEQRHAQLVVAREAADAADAREAPSDDDHVLGRGHEADHPRLAGGRHHPERVMRPADLRRRP
jgi:hypothetical protein